MKAGSSKGQVGSLLITLASRDLVRPRETTCEVQGEEGSLTDLWISGCGEVCRMPTGPLSATLDKAREHAHYLDLSPGRDRKLNFSHIYI